VAKIETLFAKPPRYHLLETEERSYFYDVNSGCIVSCDDVDKEILRHVGQRSFREVTRALGEELSPSRVISSLTDIIDLATEHTPPLLSQETPETIQYHLSFECFSEFLSQRLQSITLCVTGACNNACRYCRYTDRSFADSDRASKTMSKEVMKRSLDYYVEHSRDLEDVSVGFYGGEPTLAMDRIREAIAHVEKHVGSRGCRFNLTTNFVDVSDRMLEFMVEHNFSVGISLDGPESVHDMHRRKANGDPTFEQVSTNLRRLRHIDEEYYNTRVIIMSTFAPLFQLEEVCAFFAENDDNLLPKSRTQIASFAVIPKNDYWDAQDPRAGLESLHLLEKRYLDCVTGGTLTFVPEGAFLRHFFDRRFLRVFRRNCRTRPLPSVLFPGGICVPGQRKLFVRYDGVFFPCERVPEHDTFRIGNCFDGLDMQKAYSLCTEFAQMSADECRECWAVLLCNLNCFKEAFDNNGPRPDMKKDACARLRRQTSEDLSTMLAVWERKPDAFTFLNDIIVS